MKGRLELFPLSSHLNISIKGRKTGIWDKIRSWKGGKHLKTKCATPPPFCCVFKPDDLKENHHNTDLLCQENANNVVADLRTSDHGVGWHDGQVTRGIILHRHRTLPRADQLVFIFVLFNEKSSRNFMVFCQTANLQLGCGRVSVVLLPNSRMVVCLMKATSPASSARHLQWYENRNLGSVKMKIPGWTIRVIKGIVCHLNGNIFICFVAWEYWYHHHVWVQSWNCNAVSLA